VNTTVVACCQLTPVLAGPITITAECRLGDALSKAVSPANDVHADRRPELYRRIAEQAIPQQTTPQQTTPQMPLPS
jgi:hypothetical protein